MNQLLVDHGISSNAMASRYIQARTATLLFIQYPKQKIKNKMIRLDFSSKATSMSVKSARLLKPREILGLRELEPRIEIDMKMGMKKGNRAESHKREETANGWTAKSRITKRVTAKSGKAKEVTAKGEIGKGTTGGIHEI